MLKKELLFSFAKIVFCLRSLRARVCAKFQSIEQRRIALIVQLGFYFIFGEKSTSRLDFQPEHASGLFHFFLFRFPFPHYVHLSIERRRCVSASIYTLVAMSCNVRYTRWMDAQMIIEHLKCTYSFDFSIFWAFELALLVKAYTHTRYSSKLATALTIWVAIVNA